MSNRNFADAFQRKIDRLIRKLNRKESDFTIAPDYTEKDRKHYLNLVNKRKMQMIRAIQASGLINSQKQELEVSIYNFVDHLTLDLKYSEQPTKTYRTSRYALTSIINPYLENNREIINQKFRRDLKNVNDQLAHQFHLSLALHNLLSEQSRRLFLRQIKRLSHVNSFNQIRLVNQDSVRFLKLYQKQARYSLAKINNLRSFSHELISLLGRWVDLSVLGINHYQLKFNQQIDDSVKRVINGRFLNTKHVYHTIAYQMAIMAIKTKATSEQRELTQASYLNSTQQQVMAKQINDRVDQISQNLKSVKTTIELEIILRRSFEALDQILSTSKISWIKCKFSKPWHDVRDNCWYRLANQPIVQNIANQLYHLRAGFQQVAQPKSVHFHSSLLLSKLRDLNSLRSKLDVYEMGMTVSKRADRASQMICFSKLPKARKHHYLSQINKQVDLNKHEITRIDSSKASMIAAEVIQNIRLILYNANVYDHRLCRSACHRIKENIRHQLVNVNDHRTVQSILSDGIVSNHLGMQLAKANSISQMEQITQDVENQLQRLVNRVVQYQSLDKQPFYSKVRLTVNHFKQVLRASYGSKALISYGLRCFDQLANLIYSQISIQTVSALKANHRQLMNRLLSFTNKLLAKEQQELYVKLQRKTIILTNWLYLFHYSDRQQSYRLDRILSQGRSRLFEAKDLRRLTQVYQASRTDLLAWQNQFIDAHSSFKRRVRQNVNHKATQVRDWIEKRSIVPDQQPLLTEKQFNEALYLFSSILNQIGDNQIDRQVQSVNQKFLQIAINVFRSVWQVRWSKLVTYLQYMSNRVEKNGLILIQDMKHQVDRSLRKIKTFSQLKTIETDLETSLQSESRLIVNMNPIWRHAQQKINQLVKQGLQVIRRSKLSDYMKTYYSTKLRKQSFELQDFNIVTRRDLIDRIERSRMTVEEVIVGSQRDVYVGDMKHFVHEIQHQLNRLPQKRSSHKFAKQMHHGFDSTVKKLNKVDTVKEVRKIVKVYEKRLHKAFNQLINQLAFKRASVEAFAKSLKKAYHQLKNSPDLASGDRQYLSDKLVSTSDQVHKEIWRAGDISRVYQLERDGTSQIKHLLSVVSVLETIGKTVSDVNRNVDRASELMSKQKGQLKTLMINTLNGKIRNQAVEQLGRVTQPMNTKAENKKYAKDRLTPVQIASSGYNEGHQTKLKNLAYHTKYKYIR